MSPGHWLSVLGLALLLVDSLGGEDFYFHPEWGFDAYEITVPRKLSFRGGEQGAFRHMSYLLQVQGQKHVLHLWPKRLLLPRHLQVFSYTEQGELVEDYPYIPRDCSYVGVVEGAEDSEATLSTCAGGLRGILKIDAKYYQMEPLRGSSGFEHALYLLKDEWGFQDRICGISGDGTEEPTAQPDILARYNDFISGPSMHQKYCELGLVFDHDRYVFSNSNLTDVTNDAILLTSIMDTYFQELRTRVMLRALEVWSERDRVDLNFPSLQQALRQFLIYQKDILSYQFKVDWSQLFIKRSFKDAVAWSWGIVCTERYAGSACAFPDMRILGPATWSAHNIGHSLGMQHDGPTCRCGGRRSCIMGTGRFGFSNCSIIHFFNHVHKAANCLNNIPGEDYVIKRCGNKIVEDEEQCDCSSLEDCEEDLCCEPGCRLRPGANCSMGLCCHQCHFRPSGHMCRKEETECDLAEYCDGVSEFCPNDTYKQDGTPCKYSAHCFQKGCHSTHVQCQSLFGAHAREAPERCYQAVNAMGDQYGNCGIVGAGDSKKCTGKNAICGRVQCIHVETLPDLPAQTSIVSTYLGEDNLMCWGVGYRLSLIPMGIPDRGGGGGGGVVYDGTSCGKDRVCVNTTCFNVSVLRFDCVPAKCNHRGYCNHDRNCHCQCGWAPPPCEDQGYGGSEDSGPPGPLPQEVPAAAQVVSLTLLLRVGLLALSMVVVFFRRFLRSLIGSGIAGMLQGLLAEELLINIFVKYKRMKSKTVKMCT
ncbi:LOW QUALITY PROTEIN: disintegrin and metalloproteinase domain-containing protein 30 [Pipistrellus kuhlii]|uniref:LOW QUALITY PROTEIN: disintegrin and metalloproteinase domain-containing protein 30 n=1 Tax=Pipistrellus kuhlii TaxID=59472 RepID=UPI001E270649|nr:LOW QUALITY PROTEIN: disintegrin and metalloproteinase domain-containing protein 30 [Pipistrellus kuhlii]